MVTQLVAGGVDWRTVSGRAGHADGHMTLGAYAHFQRAQDRHAADLMESLFAPAATSDSRWRGKVGRKGMAGIEDNTLRTVLEELGWSLTRLVAEMRRHAGGVALPKTESLITLVSRWVNNHQQPEDFYRDLLAKALARPRAERFSDDATRAELATNSASQVQGRPDAQVGAASSGSHAPSRRG